jgi:hypothetical protein
VRARRSLPVLNAESIELITTRKHPDLPQIEEDLVQAARRGELKGVVIKPPRYSASTIQNYSDCARKYYWPTLAGLEDPPSGAQALGTELHKYAEDYLKSGKLPKATTKAARLFLRGLKVLPQPMTPGMRVEENFEVKFDGVPVLVTGQVDLSIDPLTKDAKSFMLGDHKTARSLKWPKTKEWLQKNIQSNLYAKVRAEALRKLGFKDLKVVDKKWFYYYKDEEIVPEPLRVVQSLDEVEGYFQDEIKPLIIGMSRMVREAPRIGDVPAADKSVCEMYRGCAHRARCFGMGARSETMGTVAKTFTKGAIAARVQGAGSAINPPKAKILPKKAPPPPIEEEEEEETVEEETEEAAAEETEEETAEEEEAPEEEQQIKSPLERRAAQLKRTGGAKKGTVKGKPAGVAPGTNAEHDFWLFVGAMPTRGWEGETTDIEQLVGAAQADGAERNGKEHYRDGASYGLLEACFAKWLEENALTGAIVVSDPTTLAARDVIGLLRAHASIVIERKA